MEELATMKRISAFDDHPQVLDTLFLKAAADDTLFVKGSVLTVTDGVAALASDADTPTGVLAGDYVLGTTPTQASVVIHGAVVKNALTAASGASLTAVCKQLKTIGIYAVKGA